MFDNFLVGWGSALIISTITFMLVYESRIGDLKSEAVKHGAAEWVVDPEDGTTQFTWKNPKKP